MPLTIPSLAASIIDLASDLGVKAEDLPVPSAVGDEAINHLRDAQEALYKVNDILQLTNEDNDRNL